MFLGYPTYALSCVLAGMLVSSGLGSMNAHRIEETALVAAITRSLGWLVLLMALLVGLYPLLFQQLLTAPVFMRTAVSLVLIAPFGLVMGRFFPLGIRVLNQLVPAYVPWAWAINGCCSVVGTILSVILAISFGFRNLFLVALAIYALGTLALRYGVRATATLHRVASSAA